MSTLSRSQLRSDGLMFTAAPVRAARVLAVSSMGHTVLERGRDGGVGWVGRRGGGTSAALPRSRYALRLEKLHRATAPLTGICRQQ